MLRSRITKMRQQSAQLAFLLLLCIFLVCGKGRHEFFGRGDVSSSESIERLGLVQRRLLQDQHTPNHTESNHEKVQESVKQGEQKKWEPKVEEKTTSIEATKNDEVALRQEPKADRDQTKVAEEDQTKVQEKDQTKVEEKDKTKVEEKDLTKVEEKEPWKRDKEGNVESKVATKVEHEEKPVARTNDEERKETNVEDKKEEPKVEERREDSKVDEPNDSMKFKPEGEGRNVSIVEDRKEESVIEVVKEVTKVEEKKSDPNLEVKKLEELEVRLEPLSGGNDERKVGDKKGEEKREETLKVQAKKDEEAQIGVKYENKKEREANQSTSAKIGEHKLVEPETEDGDMHADLDDDYPDFLDELRNFPERFQKTAESVKDHIRFSGLDRYSMHSKELFNQANQQIQESFTPLLGKDYAPFLAYLVSYGLLLLPLALVTYLFDRVRAKYSLQKILLFVNIYLAGYFAALLVVALVLDRELLGFFMKYSSTSYIFLQLLQGFGYVIYLLLNTADLISTCSNGKFAARFSSLLQWVVVIGVGFHYYVTVFHRAMARKAPLTNWKIYGLYSVAFIFLCLFTRIEWGKKHYIPISVDDRTDKKN